MLTSVRCAGAVVAICAGFLLPSTSASAQLAGNPCAAACVAAEQEVKTRGGKAYLITQEDKKAFEQKVRQLMYVSPIDVDTRGKNIDMPARGDFFTEKGWADYEAYVAKVKAHLKQRSDKGEISPNNSLTGSFFAGTQHYSDGEEQLGFSAVGYLGSWDRDQGVPDAGMFEIHIQFSPKKPDSPDNVLIDLWRVRMYMQTVQ